MNTPYFLWDYDWSESKVRRILKEGDEYQKRWLIARIISSASFEDVFEYLNLKEIVEIWPKLKMRPEIKRAWEKAFKAWGINVQAQT